MSIIADCQRHDERRVKPAVFQRHFLKPRKVFLQIGTNDFHKRRAVEYIFSKIKRIIEVLKEHLPETKFILFLYTPSTLKIKVFGKIVTYPRKNKNIDRVTFA